MLLPKINIHSTKRLTELLSAEPLRLWCKSSIHACIDGNCYANCSFCASVTSQVFSKSCQVFLKVLELHLWSLEQVVWLRQWIQTCLSTSILREELVGMLVIPEKTDVSWEYWNKFMFMFRFEIKVDKFTAHLIKVPEVICHYVRQKTFHAVLHEEKEGRGVSLRVY